MADSYDAARANDTAVRQKLRNRSRYETANNSYAKGIVLTLANDSIGNGPRLQMLTGNPDLNTNIENEWDRWSKRTNLAAKLRTLRQARATDGEVFVQMFSNASTFPITLDFRLIEADQVDTPAVSEGYVQGIKFDQYGQPESYALLNSHPGGLSFHTGFDPIAARYMLHWFRVDRPGQIRGVPELTPALGLFAQLRRYTIAVLSASELAAEWTAFLKTNAPPDSGAAKIEDGDFAQVDIERNALTTLPEGWEPFQLKPEQPATTYEMFQQAILNEIARCLNMPYNIAAGNSSSYNYASGRLDHQMYFKAIGVDQSDCESKILDPFLAEFLAEYQTSMAVAVPITTHQWFWPGREHVDPNKEATAQAKRLENNTTTLAAEYAKDGKDWETELRQRAKEIELSKSLGLTPEDVAPLPQESTQ